MKIEEVSLFETEYKTERKFAKTGTTRLSRTMVNADHQSAMKVLMDVCEAVDCNFHEVLDAVNRTVR